LQSHVGVFWQVTDYVDSELVSLVRQSDTGAR